MGDISSPVDQRFVESVERLLTSNDTERKANASIKAQDLDLMGKVSGHLCYT